LFWRANQCSNGEHDRAAICGHKADGQITDTARTDNATFAITATTSTGHLSGTY
jgi:hypothetical protein